MEVHCLFKFQKSPYKGPEVDTTRGTGTFRDLSPFVLSAKPYDCWVFENLWQFSKVYAPEHVDADWNPNHEWFEWQKKGFNEMRAFRYPMGKGRAPRYSMWKGERLLYIEARKKLYAPVYAELVRGTLSFMLLRELYDKNSPVILRDYDAYDHIKLGMTLKDVINDPSRKMGHAFVLAMMLTGVLEECLEE